MALSSSTLSIKNLYKKLSSKFELLSRQLKYSWPQCGGEKNASADTKFENHGRDGGAVVHAGLNLVNFVWYYKLLKD